MNQLAMLFELERVVAEWARPKNCACNMFKAKGICWHTGYRHETRS